MSETIDVLPPTNLSTAEQHARPLVPLLDNRPRIVNQTLSNESERNSAIEWNNTVCRANRIATDGALYVQQLPHEIGLSSELSHNLSGEGTPQSRSTGTSGVAYASHIVARAVLSQGQNRAAGLFADGKLPARRVFEDLLWRKVGGEVGMIMTTLLMDTVYPYQHQKGDGFVELPATARDKAFLVQNGIARNRIEAKFCSETEVHFGNLASHPLKSVVFNGKVVALKKHVGDHTAILVQPAIINDVRIPVGSIVTIDRDEQGSPTFAFGRLSPFCLADAYDGKRQFPEILNQEFKSDPNYLAGDLPSGYQGIVDLVNLYADRAAPSALQLVDDYIRRHPEASPVQAADALRAELDQDLLEQPMCRFVAMVQKENEASLLAGAAMIRDKQAVDADRNDPGERHTEVSETLRLRALYYRFFGFESVKAAEQTMAIRDALVRYGAAAQP